MFKSNPEGVYLSVHVLKYVTHVQGRIPVTATAWYVEVGFDVSTDGKRNIPDVVLQTQYTINTEANHRVMIVFIIMLVVTHIVVTPFVEAHVATKTIVPLQALSVESRGMLFVKHCDHTTPVSETGAQDTLDGGITFDKMFDGKTGSDASSEAYTCLVLLCLRTERQRHHQG